MKDTPNPFVASQTNPRKFEEISKDIEQKTGQNTLEEMNKRMGTIQKCPTCGKPLTSNE